MLSPEERLEENFEKKSLSVEERLDLLENVIKLNTERLKNLENIEYKLTYKKTTLGEIAKKQFVRDNKKI